MTARLAMAPPLLTQRERARFRAMWYWLHARSCPLVYRARVTAKAYRA